MWPHYVHHTLHSAGDVTIPGGMTFTLDSDLNGESPQFTLTCTSTGGPATTVTGTRDSEAVSGWMNQTVLDDPVTAQYTHTLTVGDWEGSTSVLCPTTNHLRTQHNSLCKVMCACEGGSIVIVLPVGSSSMCSTLNVPLSL